MEIGRWLRSGCPEESRLLQGLLVRGRLKEEKEEEGIGEVRGRGIGWRETEREEEGK